MSFRAKLYQMILILLAISIGLTGAWLITTSFDDALEREVEAAQSDTRMALYALAAASGGHIEGQEKTLTETVRSMEQQSSAMYCLTAADGVRLYQDDRIGFLDSMADAARPDALVWRIGEHEDWHYLQIVGALTDPDGGIVYLEALHTV